MSHKVFLNLLLFLKIDSMIEFAKEISLQQGALQYALLLDLIVISSHLYHSVLNITIHDVSTKYQTVQPTLRKNNTVAIERPLQNILTFLIQNNALK